MKTEVTKIHIKMRMLINIIRYVCDYAYEHNLLDLMSYINDRLTEIEEVDA